MSGSANVLFTVRDQVENSLRGANLPAEDMEEIAAILTTSTRSLERKLQREGASLDAAAADRLVTMFRQRCVDDEGLVDPTTWNQVEQSVAVPATGAGGSFDAMGELKRIEASTQQALQQLSSLPPDVKEESAAVAVSYTHLRAHETEADL
eukprot:2674204-Rhodomonas_salina.1